MASDRPGRPESREGLGGHKTPMATARLGATKGDAKTAPAPPPPKRHAAERRLSVGRRRPGTAEPHGSAAEQRRPRQRNECLRHRGSVEGSRASPLTRRAKAPPPRDLGPDGWNHGRPRRRKAESRTRRRRRWSATPTRRRRRRLRWLRRFSRQSRRRRRSKYCPPRQRQHGHGCCLEALGQGWRKRWRWWWRRAWRRRRAARRWKLQRAAGGRGADGGAGSGGAGGLSVGSCSREGADERGWDQAPSDARRGGHRRKANGQRRALPA